MRAVVSLLSLSSLLVPLAACGTATPPPADQRVDVAVMSGRPQPPPQDVGVRSGVPVVVHAEGIGPPRVVVFAPDGSKVPTTDVGSGQRFTPSTAGTYRVEHAEVAGLVLVNVVAK